MKYVNRPLFKMVEKIPQEYYGLDDPNKKKEIIKSECDGFVSIIDFNEHTDRFKLMHQNNIYACKFYNKDKNNFIGASFMAMYNLDRYFDRNIIKEEYYS